MKDAELGKIIGANVARIRIERGLSQNALRKKVPCGLYTIQQIENGNTHLSRLLPRIAQVLQVKLEELNPSLKDADHQAEQIIPREQLIGERDLPLYATTEAGDGILVMSSGAVERVDRPSSLSRVKDAYGVIVTGDSMVPRVNDGDIVTVHPHKRPRHGDLCVFRSQMHGEFRSTLKEFVSATADCWIVLRYHPKRKEYQLSRAEWPECHVVETIVLR